MDEIKEFVDISLSYFIKACTPCGLSVGYRQQTLATSISHCCVHYLAILFPELQPHHGPIFIYVGINRLGCRQVLIDLARKGGEVNSSCVSAEGAQLIYRANGLTRFLDVRPAV